MIFESISILEIVLGTSAIIVTSYLGVAVYIRNPKSWTNRLFGLLALVINAYVLVNPLSLHPPGGRPEDQLFWIRWVMFLAALLATILFLLSHTFPKDGLRLKRPYLTGITIWTVVNAILALTPAVFSEIQYPNGEPLPSIGFWMPFYFLHFVGFVLASFVVLFKNYRSAQGIERAKYLYLLLGIVVSFSLMAVFTIVFVVVLKTSAGIFLGPIFPVILAIAIAYSIVKHHFLDIHPIIARAASYVLLIIVTAIFYAAVAIILTNLFLGIEINYAYLVFSAVAVVVISLSFQPLARAMSRWTDRVLFKGLYDPDKLLSKLTRIMAATIDLDELKRETLTILTREMRISKAAMLIINSHKISSSELVGYGADILRSPIESVLHEGSWTTTNMPVLLQNIKIDSLKNIMRQYAMEVIIPIKVGQVEVAILILGPKSSGDLYSRQDLQLLEVFASEAGVAIKNAASYKEIRVLSESKSRFVSVASHQLRTPISAIRWSLELMNKKGRSISSQKKLVPQIYQNVIFLESQLDDILTALDIYDRKLVIKKVECDLAEILKARVREFDSLIREKGLKLRYDFEPEALSVKADPEKLKKMLAILIKNAVVYSSAGGEVDIVSRSETRNGRRYTTVSVRDGGVGITEEEHKNLFVEFFRSDQARISWPNGLGLGLFIAKTFVEAHDGQIGVYSEGRDKGAEFFLALPLE
ncbi:MAG: ATP-binding protein [bacterium]|nr:ATP-binding protein [bacterium]